MSQNPYVIAVDLGGTNLRVGAVNKDGFVEEREKYPSESKSGSGAVLERVSQAIHSVAKKVEGRKGRIKGVSLGFPGIVDHRKGVVHQSPHFPDWKNLDILSFFKNQFSWPILVDNDANMAALGEGWKGAAKGLNNYVMLTFGTGVGGGIVIDGKILHGDRGFAGEVGHICIEANGPPCACGSRGCFEMYVSSQGILRSVERTEDIEQRVQLLKRFGRGAEMLTVQYLYEAALDGDIFANVTFKKMGYYLGIGIASLTNTLGIESFILGGGVSQAWDFFIEPAKKELAERTYPEIARSLRLHRARLNDDAALIGGASLFFETSSSHEP